MENTQHFYTLSYTIFIHFKVLNKLLTNMYKIQLTVTLCCFILTFTSADIIYKFLKFHSTLFEKRFFFDRFIQTPPSPT